MRIWILFGAFYISREETIYIKIEAEFSFVSVFAQLSTVQPGRTGSDWSIGQKSLLKNQHNLEIVIKEVKNFIRLFTATQ